MEAKIDQTKQKIVEQEAQIAELKAESIDLQKREKQGIANITQVRRFQRHKIKKKTNSLIQVKRRYQECRRRYNRRTAGARGPAN